ncbi:60S ribosomal protein L35 [Cotesia glomerata]|uniref:Large ribosomal subunit protein uL29 n=1 Tax=Cotesia glomerata TaxID=32391 RepID=A0AAV7HYM1_COTGL|nr:60S ribosomal protein L35 [Cotesia glomerata]KAH0539543.1 hypothetical protein KQX54_005440 [Cotesia glomerata]
MKKPRCSELRAKNKKELLTQLEELKKELMSARVARHNSSDPLKLRVLRKSIARIHIIINQKQKENLRLLYTNKKWKPLDLRPKKTRAIRRRLTTHQENAKTLKETRKLSKWPQRKFAVKA